MSAVRVLVGTRKGAFVLEADGKRAKWKIHGPHFAGWEIYHLKASPADPNRIYASQSTSWFGQLIQRSDDGGRTWAPMGNRFEYEGTPGTHQWYDGTPHPWEFARVWHLEPSLSDPDALYAGVEDAALFRSTDGATRGKSCPACAAHLGRLVAAGRGRHVPAHDRRGSAQPGSDLHRHLRGRRVSQRRRGRDVAPDQPRPEIEYIPQQEAEVGHCVHRLAMHPAGPTCCSCRSTGT